MNQGAAPKLVRELGLGSAIVLVIANMVGSGVFTTSGFILGELGSSQALLACWLLGGLFALAGALCYGELGAMFPQAGGEYVYLKRSFGPFAAFLSGWISLFVGFSAPIAAAAIAFSTYLLGGTPEPWLTLGPPGKAWLTFSPVSLLAIGAVLVFSFLHAHSLRLGRNVQNLLTGIKVAFILALLIGALFYGKGDGARLGGALSGAWKGVGLGSSAVALVFVSFSYSGWNAAAYLGGEIRRPERNLPLALLLGTLVVTGIYLALNLVYIYALPEASMRGMLEVGSGAAAALFGRGAGRVAGLAITLGLLSVISAMVMSGPRVYYAMARDGLFLRGMERVGKGTHTPLRAIALQALIAILMILSVTFETLLIYVGFTLSLACMLTVIGLMRLRRTEPGLPRPYRTWGYPITPLFFILGNGGIVVYSLVSRPVVALCGLATLATGVLAYLAFRRCRPLPEEEALEEAQELPRPV